MFLLRGLIKKSSGGFCKEGKRRPGPVQQKEERDGTGEYKKPTPFGLITNCIC